MASVTTSGHERNPYLTAAFWSRILRFSSCQPALRAVPWRVGDGMAQTPDPAIRSSTMRWCRISIRINPRDWVAQEHFPEALLPADFRWGPQVVRGRHPVARHRQPQRCKNPALPRLRQVPTDQVPRPQVVPPAEQHAGRVEHARGAQHELLRRLASGAARSVRAVVRERRLPGLIPSSSRSTRRSCRRTSTNDATSTNTTSTAWRVPFVFDISARTWRSVRRSRSNPRRMNRSEARSAQRFLWTVNEAGDAPASDDGVPRPQWFMRHLGVENFLAEEDGLTGDYGRTTSASTDALERTCSRSFRGTRATRSGTAQCGIFRTSQRARKAAATGWCCALKCDDLLNIYLDVAAAVSAEQTARRLRDGSSRPPRAITISSSARSPTRETVFKRGVRAGGLSM